MKAVEQLGLRLELTTSMKSGTQRIFQCSQCGTILVVPSGRKPTLPCPACDTECKWWLQNLPVAGLRAP